MPSDAHACPLRNATLAGAAGQGHPAPAPGSCAFRLLNDYQRGFPLVSRPFATIGAEVGMREDAVLETCRAWTQDGVISRIGAVLAPRRVGASALAALSAPVAKLEEIAAIVSALPEVNHNYLREHAYNLWFVITAESAARLAEVVSGIERDSGSAVIVLPLEEEFHIDLGFCLAGGVRDALAGEPATPPPFDDAACALPTIERSLMAALQRGLPLVVNPYEELGRSVGLSEAMAIELIEAWMRDGIIKRFGVVVRHHELGYSANAMCVWDVPDERVREMGRRLAGEAAVTLCYRRGRVLPDWPYNLFCMIHGKSRAQVLAARAAIATRLELDEWPHTVLFSTRRFKQRGARYWPDAASQQGCGDGSRGSHGE